MLEKNGEEWKTAKDDEQFFSILNDEGEKIMKTRSVGIRRGLNSGFLGTNNQRGLDILCSTCGKGQVLAIIKTPKALLS